MMENLMQMAKNIKNIKDKEAKKRQAHLLLMSLKASLNGAK